MTEHLKDANDRFDDMVQHEERIRLGEEGWKGRYYEVCIGMQWFCTSACNLWQCVPS